MSESILTEQAQASLPSPPAPEQAPSASSQTSSAADKSDAAPDTKPNEAGVQSVMRVLRIRREAQRRLDAEEHPPLTLPPFVKLRDRLALPRPEIRWRIEGWLPIDSRVMVTAQFKAGKTTLVGNLLRSLVDGDDWLEAADVEPIDGCVVLIDTEMAQTQLDDWHRDQGIRADDRIVPVSLRGSLTAFNLLDATVRSKWAARFRTLGTQYLIFDCLRPILDALGLDERHEAGRFLVAFDALLLEAGIREAAVIHHMGHGAERSRGDSRLRDWPDVEWTLVRKNPDAASPRFISAYGRDVEIPESELAYDPKQRRLKLTGGGTRRDVNIQGALAAVLDVLKDATPRSFRQLQNEAQRRCGFTRECVRTAIAVGVQLKKIVTEPGPKRAVLHALPPPLDTIASATVTTPPVGECAELCDDRSAHSVGECASASIEARTRHTHAEGGTPPPHPHTARARPVPAASPRARRTGA